MIVLSLNFKSNKIMETINIKPTEKQLQYISFIESETGIRFTGTTKSEASKYIDENKSKIPFDAYESDWAIINGY